MEVAQVDGAQEDQAVQADVSSPPNTLNSYSVCKLILTKNMINL